MAPGRSSFAQMQATTSVEPTTGTDVQPPEPPRRRSRAANKRVKNFKKANNGQRPRVVIKEGMTTPVGQWSTEFVNEIGIICRRCAPLTIRDWRLVKQPARDTMHEQLLKRFDIDLHLPHVQKAVNKCLGQRFKDYRHTLHQHYLKFGNDDQTRRKTPFDNVGQEAWISICDWFATEKFQGIPHLDNSLQD
ncbi:hypothetical protein FRX31_006659, partial [Thalictrum thalictroides]